MSNKQVDTQNIQKKPLISFVVTTYNLEPEMVAECLESILSLSVSSKDREIILVDDGSDIPAIIQLADYQGDLIYVRQPNGGPSVARNMGIRVATGKYIQFVDADDKLCTQAYEQCLDIARYESPDMVLFDFTDKEKESNVSFKFSEPTTGIEYMRNNNIYGTPWSYLFRKDILGSLLFTPGKMCEDEEFNPQLFLRANKVYKTNAKAYFYRQRQGSIMNNSDKRKIVTRLNDCFGIICHLQEVATNLPEDARQALQRRVAQLSMDYLYNTARYTKSIHQLEEAINKLYEKGLYPLPDKNYTLKYKAFRRLISTKIGRYLLIMNGLKG